MKFKDIKSQNQHRKPIRCDPYMTVNYFSRCLNVLHDLSDLNDCYVPVCKPLVCAHICRVVHWLHVCHNCSQKKNPSVSLYCVCISS